MVKPPLLAIVGPTASGKSDLGLELAEQFQGEIICADSRTVYRGMDIGTAKPSREDQARVPHHLLDLIEPNQTYSAAQFKEAADRTVADIQDRDRLPILVGGTGLYLNAVLYDYSFPSGASQSLRAELDKLDLADLVARLRQADPQRADEIDLNNKRRVIRAIETAGQPRVAPKTLPQGVSIVGLNPGMEELEQCIARRTSQMLEAGLVREVEDLISRFDPVTEPFRTIGYAETIDHLAGRLDAPELEAKISLHTRQLAKRQLTWLKRNPDINWAQNAHQALEICQQSLGRAL